ncbi:hypothetical protein V2O64_11360 [Verrucomicrobiaceae bacterium 227]
MKALFLLLFLALPVSALLDDPEEGVVYVEEFAPKGITLKVEKPGWVYATNKGGRKRGALKTGIDVELVSFTEKAYFVRGKRESGEGVSGWVTPAAFSSTDPEFVTKLKLVHTRQILVRELIEKKEIALGMTSREASEVLGRPTKKTVRRNATGQTEVWEFIDYETINHYANVRDPYTGTIFRQLTHTTEEIKSRTVVEFENGYITSTEETKNRKGGAPKIVTCPIVFSW